MKQYLYAAIVCWSVCLMTLLSGCSNLYNSTPEFATAYEVQGRVHALAAQVRGAERVSRAEAVRNGERFYANCETYARTVADLLVNDYGADPAEVYLVTVHIPAKGFAWVYENGKWGKDKGIGHMIVEYQGWIIDNRWNGVLTRKDLEWEYEFVGKKAWADK